MEMKLHVDGSEHTVDVDETTPLLYVLRDELGLSGPRFGCGAGQCGSCTVLVDGRPLRSCLRPVSQLGGRRIVTLAGLGSRSKPHPVQAAFLEEQGAAVRLLLQRHDPHCGGPPRARPAAFGSCRP